MAIFSFKKTHKSDTSKSPNESGDEQTSPPKNPDPSFEEPDLQSGSRRDSQESSAFTLADDDSVSISDTLIETHPGHNPDVYEDQYRRVLPIYSTLFKNGIHVYESEDAAKLARKLHKNSSSSRTHALDRQNVSMPSCIQTFVPTHIPFMSTNTPYMIIYRQGNRLLSDQVNDPEFTYYPDYNESNQNHDTSSPSSSIDKTEEKKIICQVWQKILSNDQIKYTLEFNDNAKVPDSTLVMINTGSKRITDSLYDGIHMRWYGTTGLASTFGSGFFELRFLNPEAVVIADAAADANIFDSSVTTPSVSNTLRRPPAALYHNFSGKVLTTNRKVGEFTIWEPGFHLSDVIISMGLVLREQEQRKNVEASHVVINKLGTGI